MRRLLLTIAILGTGLSIAPPALAAEVYVVKAHDVYVRNKVKGYVIGTLYAGEQVVIQRRSQNWGYGGRPCGWVELGDRGREFAHGTGARADAACPAPGSSLSESHLFQPHSYFSHIGTGAVWMARVAPCIDPTAWGNYDPLAGTFSHPYGQLPVGRGFDVDGFGMRYRTRDGTAVMVKDSHNPVGAPTWFFMRTECLEVPPVYLGMRHQFDDPSLGFYPGGDPSVRPRHVYVSASMGFYYNSAARLRWRWWGPGKITASGVGSFNECFPCSANRYAVRPGAKVVLSGRRPGNCKGSTGVFYTRARVRLPRYKGPHWRRAAGGTYKVRLVPTCG
jgi:hypothetical protein